MAKRVFKAARGVVKRYGRGMKRKAAPPRRKSLKRKAPQQRRNNKRPKVQRMRDGGGYNQFTSYKFRSGKKKTRRAVQSRLISAVMTRNKLRFSGINELSAGIGFFPLSHNNQTADWDHLPVYCMNLSTLRNNPTYARPLWRLYKNKTTDQLGWTQWNGQLRSGGISTEWQLEDNESNIEVPHGRKAYLDWVRLKLNVWGKQQAPARISIQLVKLSHEELCPETHTILRPGGAATTAEMEDFDAQQYWASVVKPLINNPCSSIVRRTKMRARVLKRWQLDINPTSTTESDADPHCKFLDIFHRVGRIYNFHAEPVSNADVDRLENSAFYGDVQNGYRPYPTRIESSLYLVIKSMQQDYVDSTSINSTVTATFDMNAQTCWRNIQATTV